MKKERIVLYDRSLPGLRQRFSGGFDYVVSEEGVQEGRSPYNSDADIRVYLNGRFSEAPLSPRMHGHLVRLLADIYEQTGARKIRKVGMNGIKIQDVIDDANGVRSEIFVRRATQQRRAA